MNHPAVAAANLAFASSPLAYFVAYALCAIIAFLGLLAGFFLARFAKEEMDTARRYFPLMQGALLSGLVATFLVSVPTNMMSLGMGAVFLAVFLLSVARKSGFVVYPLLAVIFFAASSVSLFLASLLIFLYGFPTGSLFALANPVTKKPLDIARTLFFSFGSFLLLGFFLLFFFFFTLL